jgi:hypothetical protein
VLAAQTARSQGTVYLSNLGQPSVGSATVGSDSWLAETLITGNNPGGYALDSVQVAMAPASGSPSGFTVMLYSKSTQASSGPIPGDSLGTLSGSSTDPVNGGIYTYTAAGLTLSSSSDYFIVLTAGTAVANGAYEWSYAGGNSYNPFGGWSFEGFFQSSDGSSWNYTSSAFAQYAIDATAVPEPGVFGLFGLGGSFLAWHRRKAKTV